MASNDTLFVTKVTKFFLAWAQAVNDFVYKGRNPNYGTTTGSANSQTLTLPTGSLYASSTDGDVFYFKAGFTNTGALTFVVVGSASVSQAVQLNGQALVGGEVQFGQTYKVISLGSLWQLSPVQLTDGLPLIVNSADITKKLRFALSAFTTATTRVWTWQDASDTVVGRATTDTLTNKTLTSPVITTPTVTNPANTVQALTDGATVNWDMNSGAYATLTTAAARTLAAPTNIKAGGHYVLLLTSGGFTPTWNSVFKGVSGGTMPVPASSGVTVYEFESDGTNLYLDLVYLPTFGTEQNTTSGTSIDFTGVPAWATKVFVQLVGVSTNGTSNLQLQIGDSGGVEATGYNSTAGGVSNAAAVGGPATVTTTGFLLTPANVAGDAWHGQILLVLENSSTATWTVSGNLITSTGSTVTMNAGSKALSPGPLDRVRLTTLNGTDTFDAGKMNIRWE